jgi:signal transduction histidine kinase
MMIGTALDMSFKPLSNSIMVLDKTGKVIASNQALSWFENEDGIVSGATTNGEFNYLEICQRAGESKTEDWRRAADGIRSVIDGSQHTFELDFERRTASGQRYFRMSVTPRLDGGGGAIVSIRDLTERRLEEERVLELSRQLIMAQEKERTRIARELHDDLNQRLALLSIELEQLGRQSPSSADEFRQRTHELWTSIRSISTDIHRIAYQLHPSKLDTLGLVAAIRGLCHEISTHQLLRVEFIHRSVPEPLSKDVALCLFRIVQEALSNVIKHSGAREARVELTGSAQAIQLRIADLGEGFDVEIVKKRGGLGLISMQERLRLVGGEISIESQPMCGTQINVQILLTAQ